MEGLTSDRTGRTLREHLMPLLSGKWQQWQRDTRKSCNRWFGDFPWLSFSATGLGCTQCRQAGTQSSWARNRACSNEPRLEFGGSLLAWHLLGTASLLEVYEEVPTRWFIVRRANSLSHRAAANFDEEGGQKSVLFKGRLVTHQQLIETFDDGTATCNQNPGSFI